MVKLLISLVCGLLLTGLAACSSSTTVTVTAGGSPSTTYSPTYSPPVSTSSEPPPPPFKLTPKDLDLSTKTTQKQCFGSAGCNVTVQVHLSMDQSTLNSMQTSDRYQVTFKLTGDDSGPIIDNLTVYGNGKYSLVEEYLSTQSSGAPITVTPTSVLKLK